MVELTENNKKVISSYQPSKEVIELTKVLRDAYKDGHEVLHREWVELNNYSVIGRMNKDQLTFNSFVDESVEDPREAWKWRGTRGQARKNTMAMHAQLTAQYILPSVFAQNEAQELDREMSDVAHDVMEWMAVNSNYRSSFLLATMGMLVNPVTYLGAEYNEVYQKVKAPNEDGSLTIKEILDEEMSGFQAPVYSADQVLIPNAYEQNIQLQKIVPKRRFIEYSEAQAMYGDHPNFVFVQKGIQSFYSEDDGLFYDVKDEEHAGMVEEVTFYWRREDLEVVFLNNVYMGDDDVSLNPMTHRDNRNAPRVPLTPFGYERVNEHFFFYKSLVNNVGWDHTLLDRMYEIVMNKEILNLIPPLAFSGVDKIDTEVVVPGAMIASENPEFKASAILPPSNTAPAYAAMREIQASMDDASQSALQRGQLPDPKQKAFSVNIANEKAEILLSSAMKSLGESVMRYGMLMLDIALMHLTVAQIDEITGKPKYRTFMLADQNVEGRKVNKKILFDETLIGRRMSEEKRKEESIKLYEESMKKEGRECIYRVNPHLWSKMKYMTRIEPDAMLPKNAAYEKAQAERMYTLLRKDPLVSPEVLVRNYIGTHYRGRENDFMPQQILDAQQMAAVPTPEAEMAVEGAPAVPV